MTQIHAAERKLDKHDRKILELLQLDARMSHAEIGEKVGLERSTVSRRIALMQEDGVIAGVTTMLEPRKVGMLTIVFTMVKLRTHGPATLTEFERALLTMPNIVESAKISGEFDYFLKVWVKDTPGHERIHDQLLSLPMVDQLRGFLVIGSQTSKPMPLGCT